MHIAWLQMSTMDSTPKNEGKEKEEGEDKNRAEAKVGIQHIYSSQPDCHCLSWKGEIRDGFAPRPNTTLQLKSPLQERSRGRGFCLCVKSDT